MCCNGGTNDHPQGTDPTSTLSPAKLIHRFGTPVLTSGDLSIDVSPRQTEANLGARVTRHLTAEWLPREMAGADLRLVSLQFHGLDDKDSNATQDSFVARVYDYTHNRTLRVSGYADRIESACVEETAA